MVELRNVEYDLEKFDLYKTKFAEQNWAMSKKDLDFKIIYIKRL